MLSAGINVNLPEDAEAGFLAGTTISSLGVETLINKLINVVISNVIITPTIKPVTK